MEEQEIFSLWKNQDTKLEQSLALNKKLLIEILSQKAQSALQTLARFKTRGIIAAVIYLVILGLALLIAIINYSSAANYFISFNRGYIFNQLKSII